MEETLRKEQDKTWNSLYELLGPGWQERWISWKSRTSEQVCTFVIKETEKVSYDNGENDLLRLIH